MTLEDSIALQILQIIIEVQPVLQKDLYKKIDSVGISDEIRYNTFDIFSSKRYTDWIFAEGYESNKAPQDKAQEYFNKRAATAKIILSNAGRRYLEYLQSEKDKEETDLLLKKLTIKHSKYHFKLTVGALVFAIFASITPFIIRSLDREKVETNKTEVLLLPKLIERQDSLLKSLKEINRSLQKVFLDKP